MQGGRGEAADRSRRGATRSAGDALFGAEVERALAALPEDGDALRTVARLRQSLDPALARRAAELALLRRRSRARFSAGWLPYLTRKGLEQASAPQVARERAERIARALPGASVLDAACGLGADAIALARAGLSVVAADLDAEVLACARANLARHGLGGRCVRADARRPAARARVLFLDPDRRAQGRRSLDPARWSPSLDEALALAARFEGACLKLPPALDPARIVPPAGLALALEWVSLERELVELRAWTGVLAGLGAAPGERAATALRASGAALRLWAAPVAVPALAPAQAQGAQWLAEPDPAVIRAGLVGRLAADEGLAPIAPRSAYLAGPRAPRSPLLARWRVLGTAPLDPRRVRALLREHDVGPLTVKKRGHPETSESLARRLRGSGSRPGLLAVARLERGHLALLLDVVGDEGFEPPASSL